MIQIISVKENIQSIYFKFKLMCYTLRMIIKNFFNGIDSIIERDPAASSRISVILLYPTVHILFLYKISKEPSNLPLRFLHLNLSNSKPGSSFKYCGTFEIALSTP